ncbi:hypothetical protein PanWU01x14_209340 [Parasponia andersonii]|uniref:Uncharacterized protein n=1 Tax=Parasponia andersonii TaxID=3476 RepID=A0A2P5BUE3_PARAD|nr:hypothetical protein PanWU01x14_209340 [Parasponia andersonii]
MKGQSRSEEAWFCCSQWWVVVNYEMTRFWARLHAAFPKLGSTTTDGDGQCWSIGMWAALLAMSHGRRGCHWRLGKAAK